MDNYNQFYKILLNYRVSRFSFKIIDHTKIKKLRITCGFFNEYGRNILGYLHSDGLSLFPIEKRHLFLLLKSVFSINLLVKGEPKRL